MRRATIALFACLLIAGAVAGCGSSKSSTNGGATAKTYPAYKTPSFKFTIDGKNVTLAYVKPPPTAKNITVICANLATNGFSDKITSTGRWVTTSKTLKVAMPQAVGARDLCAAQLGSANSTVVAFLNPQAQQKYEADQKQQATPSTP